MDSIELLPNLHIEDCTECPLSKGRGYIVPSYLPDSAEILFLNESPGEVEDREGIMPLTGNAGAFLDDCLRAIGEERFNGRYAFINVVKCRPVAEKEGKVNRPVKPSEIEACSQFIDAEIRSLPKLKIIIALGATSGSRIYGKLGLTIDELRDYVIYSKEFNVRVVTTYHPAMINHFTLALQKAKIRTGVINDIQKAISLTAEDYTPVVHKSHVAKNLKQVDWLFDNLNRQELVSWDTETSSLDYLESKILCHSFSWKVGTGYTLPLLGQYCNPIWDKDEYEYILWKVKDFLENPNIKKIAQNGKFDIQQMRSQGVNVQNFYADTMLQHYLTNENIEHGLKMLAWLFTDYGGYEEELDAIREKYAKEHGMKKKEASFDIIPGEILWKYASTDPDTTLQLYYKLKPILEKEGTLELHDTLYVPFTRMLADMEYEGVLIDKPYLEGVQEQYRQRIAELEKQMFVHPEVLKFVENKKNEHRRLRGEKWEKSKASQKKYSKEDYCNIGIEEIVFNPGSSKQLKELFIDQLKLKVGKTTKSGGASFDAEAMEVYARKVPLAKILSDINKASNFLTTFLDGIHSRIRVDGRIHTSINLQVADTGRLSSSAPNLQNVPNSTNNPVDSKLIRDMFLPDPDYVFLEYDQAQCEFRSWCQMSGDEVMKADLAAGLDIHTEIASKGFGVSKDQVTKAQRGGAKGVTFGKMFGRGNRSVAEQLGISVKEAEKIEAILFQKYKKAAAWLKSMVQKAHEDKQVVNIFGFVRHFKHILEHPDQGVRAQVDRLAVNSPIQGAASQMVCYAGLRIYNLFKEYRIRGRLVWPIHDAWLMCVHKDDVEDAIPLIEEGMEHPHYKIDVPLKAEGKVGSKWGSMEDVDKVYSHLKEG